MDQSPNSQIKVLAIDDNLFDREMYVTALTSAGYSVNTADNGVDGLAMLKSNNYDVVLLDLILPKLSGYELLKSWRQAVPHGQRPAFIVLTNYEQTEKIKQDVISLVDAYAVKVELTPRRLREIIANITKSC